jgi:hypothetical protein
MPSVSAPKPRPRVFVIFADRHRRGRRTRLIHRQGQSTLAMTEAATFPDWAAARAFALEHGVLLGTLAHVGVMPTSGGKSPQRRRTT